MRLKSRNQNCCLCLCVLFVVATQKITPNYHGVARVARFPSYYAKVGVRAKEMEDQRGREKTPLDISRLSSFIN